VSAFPELINQGRDWAEAIHTITLATGESAEVASKQAAIYKFLGGSTDQYTTQIVRLSARVQGLSGEILKKYNIALEDSNGNSLSAIQIVENMRQVFSKLPDGIDKTGISFKLFGQRGAQAFGPLIHFLGLTDEQLKLLGDDAEKQGLVLTDEQIKLADETEKAQNRVGNAITGLAAKVFTVLGPGITSFFDGLAETITANSKAIVDALGSAATAVLGFVEGLIGINPALDSFSTQFTRIDEGGSNTSATLIRLNDELGKLKDKLNPTADATKSLNTAIDAEAKAIEADIVQINKLGDARDRNFQRGLTWLTKALDIELRLFDAEDKASARADRDLAQTRALRDAKIALFEAQAQLRKDAMEGKSTDQDALNIAKQQQAVLDAQKAIGDEARSRIVDDRRTQIAAVKDYVAAVGKIVESSENKKAAVANLTTRKGVLQDQLATATAKGNAQEVADLKVKLASVDAGIIEENAKIKQAAQVDELTARKNALQAERTTEGAINRAATKVAIDLKQKEIDAEKRRIALVHADNLKIATDMDHLTQSVEGSGSKGGLVGAYEDARQAGVAFASDVHDALVGKDGNSGVLGAVKSIVGALASITKWAADNQGTVTILAGILGVSTANPALVGGAFASSANAPVGNRFTPIEDFLYSQFGIITPGWKPAPAGADERPGRKAPAHAEGLWDSASDHLAYIHQGEMVFPASVADAFRRSVTPQMPAMALARAPSGQPVVIRLELGGRPVLDYVDEHLSYRSGRGGRQAGRR
jgi:hypothetical protein